MKKYDREKRRWVDVNTGGGKFAKRDTCRGGKPHDFILSLPQYVRVTDDIVPEAILEYYASEERRAKFEKEEEEKLAKVGIKQTRGHHTAWRYYRCSVCDKRDYKEAL